MSIPLADTRAAARGTSATRTHWRTGTRGMTWSTRCAAVCDIRRAPHEGQNPRRLQQVAGNLVALNKLPGAAGMSWGQAFAAISSVPAEISGMGGKAGVLKAGALGDVVLWTGDPLEVGSVPTRVFIGGVEQDLTNHQTRLRDRYMDLDESDRPKAYDW